MTVHANMILETVIEATTFPTARNTKLLLVLQCLTRILKEQAYMTHVPCLLIALLAIDMLVCLASQCWPFYSKHTQITPALSMIDAHHLAVNIILTTIHIAIVWKIKREKTTVWLKQLRRIRIHLSKPVSLLTRFLPHVVSRVWLLSSSWSYYSTLR